MIIIKPHFNIKPARVFLFLSILFVFGCKTIPLSVKKNSELLNQLQKEGLTKIAFGSCSDQDREQVLWPEIIDHKPNLWIWLGDNIYADTENMDSMQQMYIKQKSNPEYQKLLNTTAIIGTWDDHDFGTNDGGKEYPKKKQSQKLLLDFLDVPKRAQQRKRPGVYTSYDFGSGQQKIKIILLDCRYFRDESIKTDSGYLSEPGADILGETQWKWLENELTESDARVNIIASGIQVIPEEHRYEKWVNFPSAKNRLFNLIDESKASRVILISGDRHMAEISKTSLPGSGQSIYDITASALTNPRSTDDPEPNRFRIGTNYNAINYALLLFDWNANNPLIWAEIWGDNNKLHLKKQLTFREGFAQ